MAYTKDEIDMALMALAGRIAAGDSFDQAMSSGIEKIDELKKTHLKSQADALDVEKKFYEVEKLKREVEGDSNIVEQLYTADAMERDATVHQAYGFADSVSFGVGTFGETFDMDHTATRLSRDTARALNKDIKIVLSGSFKGRPSNYLLREIEELLPSIGNWWGGDAVAESRYKALKGRFDAWLPELDGEIRIATGKTKIDLMKQRAKAGHIAKRLAVVINGFDENGTKPNVNLEPTVPRGYQFSDSEEGLDELLGYWNEVQPGKPYKKL